MVNDAKGELMDATTIYEMDKIVSDLTTEISKIEKIGE